MTKNKRFIYAKSEGGAGYGIYDTTKKYTFFVLPREYEPKVLDEFFNGAIENAEHNGKLQKENEQLKQENEELLKNIDRLVEVTGLNIDDIINKYTQDI